MVLRRISNSLAYRSMSLYRLILSIWPLPRVPHKPSLDATYLTFAGEAHLWMLRESLASLAQTWDRLPKLRVVGDGTISTQRLKDALRFWPSTIEALDWRDLVPQVHTRGYEGIVRFAKRVPMARKLVAVVATALDGPVLYADVDVLWFRLPASIFEGDFLRKPRIAMSIDFGASYDPNLVPAVLPHLASPPHFCAGILFANGDFLATGQMNRLIEFAAERGFALTEQTVLAEANYQRGGEFLCESEFALFEGDRFSHKPSFVGKPWAARHYVGQVRHIFWRDALALRGGVR